MPIVYLYWARRSRLGTSASTPTIVATDTKSQTTWPVASSGARRVTKVMPMPESTKTMGRMAGSAPGANTRTPMCAAMKATMRPMGTASVVRLSSAPVFITYME